MTAEEILQLLQEKIAIHKQRESNAKIKAKDNPGYTPVYNKTVDLWEDIKVHSSGMDFPERLFKSKAPNEHPAEFAYRKDTYQPSTRTIYREGVSNINRIFNEQNYSITGWGNNEGIYKNDAAKEYFITDYPEHGSIANFFKQEVKAAMLEDPNAVMVLDIDNIDAQDTEFAKPVLKIFHCDRIYSYKPRQYVMVLLDVRSWVEHYNTQKKDGLIFRFYDENVIYTITQYGKKIDWRFDIEVYYNHNLGYCPAWKLKGIPHHLENEVFYESYINDCVYPLNDALYYDSTLRACTVAHAFPERWEYKQKCGKCEGLGEYQDINSEFHAMVTCGVCHGTGYEKQSMFRTMYIDVPEDTSRKEAVKPPPAGYIAKSPETLEFLDKQIGSKIELAFTFMGIELSRSKVSGKETATGRLIDREALFSFLTDVSDNIFELMKECIWALGQVRYNDFIMPEVKQPKNFAIRTEEDLVKEIGEARANNVPDYVIGQLINELNRVRFSSETQIKTVGELQSKIDPLYLRTFEEVVRAKALNMISRLDATLHLKFDYILSTVLEANENFMVLNLEQQKEIMRAEAQKLIEPLPGNTEDLLGQLQQPELN